jgi:hypothetical protein
MHLDTHVLEFEFLDCDYVKPFKSKLFIHPNLTSKTCFFLYDIKVHCMFYFIKSCPKPFQNATYE